MKRFVLVSLLLSFVLMQICGCSIDTYKTARISKNPSLARIDVNNLPFDMQIERLPDNHINILILGSPKIEPGAGKTFSIKYHNSLLHSSPQVYVPVEFPNGRKYVAYVDTGCDLPVWLTSDIVVKNKLAILPVMSSADIGFSGLCHIPSLKFGPAQIRDAVGFYIEQQWHLRFMNITFYKHPDIMFGREFLKSFDYILFDNVNKEVGFSMDGAFKPQKGEEWESYSFSTDPAVHSDTIMVKMPIAGQVLEVAFDSGGGKPGLDLNKSHWQAIEKNLTVKRLVDTQITIWQGDRWPCIKATVSEISIGPKILKNADVIIDDNPEHLSVISLGYFQDTVVVLDYVNNLMWIKK